MSALLLTIHHKNKGIKTKLDWTKNNWGETQ